MIICQVTEIHLTQFYKEELFFPISVDSIYIKLYFF